MFTSSSSKIPNLDSTSSLIRIANSRTSAPVASWWLTITSECLGYVPTLPTRFPFQPHFSINHPAATLTELSTNLKAITSLCSALIISNRFLSTIGFLKKLSYLNYSFSNISNSRLNNFCFF